MSSITEYIKCPYCQNNEMISDYHYKSEELYESCDICGYYHTIKLTNKIADGKYPEDWKPKYDEKKGKGYVVKIFNKDSNGFAVCICEEKDLEDLIDKLEEDDDVSLFAITHKGKNGYKTQIFKN